MNKNIQNLLKLKVVKKSFSRSLDLDYFKKNKRQFKIIHPLSGANEYKSILENNFIIRLVR